MWFGPSWETFGSFLAYVGDNCSTSDFHVQKKQRCALEVGGRCARPGGVPFAITLQGILEGDLIRLWLGFRPSVAEFTVFAYAADLSPLASKTVET